GTGIGLALVQELVRVHGGSVAVKSAVGFGSTFTVTLPHGKEHLPAESIRADGPLGSSEIRADAFVEEALRWLPEASSASVDVATPANWSPAAARREAEDGAKRELIVLADDNRDMRDYLARLLGDRYEVHAVADGHQALEVTRQLRPALVLADVMMPQLDGFGLLRAIRDDSTLSSTPVILASARAGEQSRVEGMEADADDYLVKPFTSRELLARVATHVKMAQLRRVTAEREERLRDLGERERESRLRADVNAAFSRATRLGEILRGCAEALVRHLDAAFARIWTINKDEGMLELQASAGMYTRLDGSYSRIPVGDLKVGWIAREKKAHLTNDVMNDPRIKDKGWAQSNGMVAFAGYPLIVEDR